MPRDIENLLEAAAGPPARLDDTRRLWRKGRRRRLRDGVAMASASTLLVVGLAVYGLPFDGDDGAPPGGGEQATSEVCSEDEFGCVRIQRGDPITLGTLLVISGENADLGLDSQRGAILAAEARGNEVAGHPIEWEHQDDHCSPEGGSDSSQNLALDPQVVAVVGTSCSSAGQTAAPVLSEGGIVLISPSNTAPQMTAREIRSPFYF